MDPLRTPLARSVLALVIGFEAFRALFAPLMVVQFNLRRDVLLPVAGALLPVIVGVALWWIGRPQIPPPQQTNSDVAG